MSLGKDLAAVRNKLGLSLEEIQSQIKIPAHVLKSIENDSIFNELES
ncbi:MAG: helix-turn-helix domain-containing protein, partial [Balneolaceae bacterium]